MLREKKENEIKLPVFGLFQDFLWRIKLLSSGLIVLSFEKLNYYVSVNMVMKGKLRN